MTKLSQEQYAELITKFAEQEVYEALEKEAKVKETAKAVMGKGKDLIDKGVSKVKGGKKYDMNKDTYFGYDPNKMMAPGAKAEAKAAKQKAKTEAKTEAKKSKEKYDINKDTYFGYDANKAMGPAKKQLSTKQKIGIGAGAGAAIGAGAYGLNRKPQFTEEEIQAAASLVEAAMYKQAAFLDMEKAEIYAEAAALAYNSL